MPVVKGSGILSKHGYYPRGKEIFINILRPEYSVSGSSVLQVEGTTSTTNQKIVSLKPHLELPWWSGG